MSHQKITFCLKDIVKHIPDYDEDIPIGLLIGQICPRAQEPYETIHGVENDPYVVRKVFRMVCHGTNYRGVGKEHQMKFPEN